VKSFQSRQNPSNKPITKKETPTIPKNGPIASAPPTDDLIKPGATIGEALGALNEALKEAKRLKESGKTDDSMMEDREAKSVSSSVNHKNSADSKLEIDFNAKDLNKDHFDFLSTNDKKDIAFKENSENGAKEKSIHGGKKLSSKEMSNNKELEKKVSKEDNIGDKDIMNKNASLVTDEKKADKLVVGNTNKSTLRNEQGIDKELKAIERVHEFEEGTENRATVRSSPLELTFDEKVVKGLENEDVPQHINSTAVTLPLEKDAKKPREPVARNLDKSAQDNKTNIDKELKAIERIHKFEEGEQNEDTYIMAATIPLEKDVKKELEKVAENLDKTPQGNEQSIGMELKGVKNVDKLDETPRKRITMKPVIELFEEQKINENKKSSEGNMNNHLATSKNAPDSKESLDNLGNLDGSDEKKPVTMMVEISLPTKVNKPQIEEVIERMRNALEEEGNEEDSDVNQSPFPNFPLVKKGVNIKNSNVKSKTRQVMAKKPLSQDNSEVDDERDFGSFLNQF